MGKGGFSNSDVPKVEEAPPIAPASPPTSESSAEVAQAARDAKQRLRSAFGNSKTVLAGGKGLGSSVQESNKKGTLG